MTRRPETLLTGLAEGLSEMDPEQRDQIKRELRALVAYGDPLHWAEAWLRCDEERRERRRTPPKRQRSSEVDWSWTTAAPSYDAKTGAPLDFGGLPIKRP
jgi:hypothetical protein